MNNEKLIRLPKEVERIDLEKTTFMEDSTSNVELPMVDEKLELVSEQYNEIASNKIPQLQGQLKDIAGLPSVLTGNMQGKIILKPNTTYTVVGSLTLLDNTYLDGRGATIKFDGGIDLGNNVELYNCNFEPLTTVVRNSDGIATSQKIIALRGINKNNINIHHCSGNGIVVSFSNATNFEIKNNVFNGGYNVCGVVQAFDNSSYGVISENEIFGGSTNGIGLHTSTRIEIKNNKIHDNGHSGIYTPYSTHLKVINNKIFNHKTFDGIDFNFGADNYTHDFKAYSVAKDNECFNNGATGIYVCGSNVVLEGNECYRNGTNGIRFYRWKSDIQDTTKSTLNKIKDNTVYNNNTKNNAKGSSLTHNLILTNVNMSDITDNIVYFDDVSITTFETNLYLVGNQNNISNNLCYSDLDITQNTCVFNGTDNYRFNNKYSKDYKQPFNVNNINRVIISGGFTSSTEVLNITKSDSVDNFANAINLNESFKVNYQGDLFSARSLKTNVAPDINTLGTLEKGMMRFATSSDGLKLYLVVGTGTATNKKVELL